MNFPPIKPTYHAKNLPEYLFYKTPHQVSNTYRMFSTKNGTYGGEIVLRKSLIQHRDDYNGATLAVDFINAKKWRQGYGTQLMNFAKNYSKRNGCNGYIILKADCGFMQQSVPHIFYRKCGFTTLDPKQDKKLDKFIKQGKNATHKDFKGMVMYYPAPTETKQPSFYDKIKEKIVSLIKN